MLIHSFLFVIQPYKYIQLPEVGACTYLDLLGSARSQQLDKKLSNLDFDHGARMI